MTKLFCLIKPKNSLCLTKLEISLYYSNVPMPMILPEEKHLD